MDRTPQKVPAGAFVGAVLLAAGMALSPAAARAYAPADGAGLFSPGLGCGPAETLVGTGAPGLLARVRAEAAGASPRRGGAAKARSAERHALRKSARPPTTAPRSARNAPQQAEQETRPAVLRSFYTCNAALAPNLAEGTGWRLVGPLRHG
jgi:hypothetical protein